MFYSANEVLVNLTEKTKVFAQKCAQQIRTTGQPPNAQKQQHKQQHRLGAASTADNVCAEHIKAISKSQVDVHRYNADKGNQSMFDAIAPRRSTANAARSKNTNLFHTLTGSLRLRRRKSLSDTEDRAKTCARKRNKANAISLGYATTRWYVKVSITPRFFQMLKKEFNTNN